MPQNGVLIFVFKDGSKVEGMWEKASRCESWNDVMKEQARLQAIKGQRRFEN